MNFFNAVAGKKNREPTYISLNLPQSSSSQANIAWANHQDVGLKKKDCRYIDIGGQVKSFISGSLDAKDSLLDRLFRAQMESSYYGMLLPWPQNPHNKLLWFDREFAKVDKLIQVLASQSPITETEYEELKKEAEFWIVELPPRTAPAQCAPSQVSACVVEEKPREVTYSVFSVPPGQTDYADAVLSALKQRVPFSLVNASDASNPDIAFVFESTGERPQNISDQLDLLKRVSELEIDRSRKNVACVVFLTALDMSTHTVASFDKKGREDFEKATGSQLFTIALTPQAFIPAGGENDRNLQALAQFATTHAPEKIRNRHETVTAVVPINYHSHRNNRFEIPQEEKNYTPRVR